MYGIVLQNNMRIGAVYMHDFIPEDAIQVESLPERDVYDYVYADGEFVYDPMPQPEHQPTQEERITVLEEQNAMLIEQNDMLTACVLEMSEILYA